MIRKWMQPLLWSALVSLPCPSPADEPPPNIVVMLVDDMGVMDTSVPFLTDGQGKPRRYPLNDHYRTPNMERLAARGIRFSQFYAMSVCSPTRIALMTGQNAARHRTTNWINPDTNNGGPNSPPDWNWRGLKPGDVTLAGLLRARGYRTIHVGKGHFAPRDSPGADPKNLGFDVNVGGASIGAPASYYGSADYGNRPGPSGKPNSHAVPNLERYHGTDTFLTDALTLEAKRHVSEAVQNRTPFFLYFAQYAVHAPFNSDPRFAPNYKASGKPPQAQAFATLVEGMDRSLGAILDHLDELGVAKNTLVIFLGDNGSDAPLGHEHAVASAAPLRGRKGSHYEGGMRVPFLAAWAGDDPNSPHQKRLPIPKNAVQTQLAAVQDLFPTILAVAGQDRPAGHLIDGHPLDRLMAGQPDPDRPRTFLMHYPHSPHRSHHFTVYRDGNWKVIYHHFPAQNGQSSHAQLFDLGADPFEQVDLAASNPDVRRRMLQGLVKALEQHKALDPVDDSGKPLKPRVD